MAISCIRADRRQRRCRADQQCRRNVGAYRASASASLADRRRHHPAAQDGVVRQRLATISGPMPPDRRASAPVVCQPVRLSRSTRSVRHDTVAIRPRRFRPAHQQRIGNERVTDRHLIRRHLAQQQRQVVQIQIMPGIHRETHVHAPCARHQQTAAPAAAHWSSRPRPGAGMGVRLSVELDAVRARRPRGDHR